MKILVVDDSKVMRSLIRRALRRAGYGGHELVEAANGAQAHEAHDREQPDLILSDWNMPDLNGLELLCQLREAGSVVPFVFVTTEGTSDRHILARDAGAAGFLVKPFSDQDLAGLLERWLGEAA